MRLSIKTKQVGGVTSIVGFALIISSGFFLSSLVRIRLEESESRAELLANAIYHRTRELVATGPDPAAALRDDAGLHSLLESSAYSTNVIYAAVVDVNGVAIAHSDATLVGQAIPPCGDLHSLLDSGPVSQIRAIYAEDGQMLEFRKPLLLGETEFGAIRLGVSTLLVRRELERALEPALVTVVLALVMASLFAAFLARLLLRPIHVIRGALTRLSQGEFGVVVNVPQKDELGELGDFFNTVSARLSSYQQAAGRRTIEADVDPLEEAVAIFNADGDLLFANAAMNVMLLPDPVTRHLEDVLPSGHPYRKAVEDTLASREPVGPVSTSVPVSGGRRTGNGSDGSQERLFQTHAIDDLDGHLVGVMLVARDLGYLSQVRSMVSDSRRLASLSRLSAGVAHEVKNPLNAIVIHLELLKQQLGTSDSAAAQEHLAVITSQMHRLDDVVQGFLKFIRPEDLKLRPVALASLTEELMPIVATEAQKHGIKVAIDIPPDLPVINADPTMLLQALLNLALNACQAMPNGGRLRIAAAPVRGRRVEVLCEDTGIGMTPDQLDRVFDLYFTTKPEGTGIGLAMVYQTVQLHEGEIEVQSAPGHGTTFRLVLPQA